MSHVHRLYVTPAGKRNGNNKTFILPEPPLVGSVRVFVNGLEQFEGADYSVSGATITMSTPPESDDAVFVHYEVEI